MRLLIHMAVLPTDARATASDLAESCEIPAGNAPTIVNMLARAGLLLSMPGRGDGCTLSRDPEQISMRQIIETLEGRLEISHRLLDSRRCHDKDPECAMREAWSR